MSADNNHIKKPFRMEFDVSTIKHLGVQMYSTLPPVIGEFVANAWDANATRVEIEIPEEPISEDRSEITIKDDGIGMSDRDIREKYLIVGRDRREKEGADKTPMPRNRPVMGRKGIGKFSAFGIAKIIDIESVSNGETSHFRMDYDQMLENEARRHIDFPQLSPSGDVPRGTMIRLQRITKYRTRSIPISVLRRGLARRFSIIGHKENFRVSINGREISVEERDFQRLLDRDEHGEPYVWKFKDVEIEPETGWTVSGWIGSLSKTSREQDGVDRGISIMARGKLVQEPFVFDALVGQQFALSYIVGELHAEFVDREEDTIGTSRNALVWDNERNTKLKEWGERTVQMIARQWGERRSKDNEMRLQRNELYREFQRRTEESGNRRALRLANALIRQTIIKTPTANVDDIAPTIQMCMHFVEFDSFLEISQDLAESDLSDVNKILALFREWEVVEAKEMARVTTGRIATIEKLQSLIQMNALEVPTLHQFLKEFPWVLDPRWTLVADEVRYSDILRKEFPEGSEVLERDKRIDFLCIRESETLVVVEIKRPKKKASKKDLLQIEDYVIFMETVVTGSTDPDFSSKRVIGYLLCGGLVDKNDVRIRAANLENSSIYVKRYDDLLSMVHKSHRDFIERYEKLKSVNIGRDSV